MKLSICIDSVMMGIDPALAIYKAHELGFTAVEFWEWEEKDIDAIVKAKEETGIEISTFCTACPNLVDENQREVYIEGLKRTIPVAKRLGCNRLISETGNEMNIERSIQHQSIIDGLKACVPILEKNDITLMIEPLNIRVDHAGYYLSSSDEAAKIVSDVGSNNIKMLFDIYHQQITEGDVIRRIKKYLPLIEHFHTAGSEGRHELYKSELDYAYIFRTLREIGYDKYVGLEYMREDELEKGLTYAKEIFYNK